MVIEKFDKKSFVFEFWESYPFFETSISCVIELLSQGWVGPKYGKGGPKILGAYFPTSTWCLFHSSNRLLRSSILLDIVIQYCSGYSYSSLRKIIEPCMVFSS